MAVTSPGSTCLGWSRIYLSDLRRYEHDARFVVHSSGGTDGYRRKRRSHRVGLTVASGWAAGDYLQRPLDELLADVAGSDPAPAAGSVTAASLSLAAALTAKVARRSTRHVSDAGALADAADALRERVVPLITGDAASYAAVLAAKRGGNDGTEPGAEAQAMADAVRIPVETAVVAADVVDLAVDLADRGNPNLRHDAIAAADLAAQCASIAASLARANAADPAFPGNDAADEAVSAAARAAKVVGAVKH